MTSLWCFSGGGMSGLDKLTGMATAAWECGLRPTSITGTSAGALVGSLLAHNWSPEDISGLLLGLRDQDVRDERVLWKLRLSFIDSIFGNEKIVRLVNALLPQDFADLALPLQVVATRLRDNQAVWFGKPVLAAPLRDAVLASMSIHGVFPTVDIGGMDYADGGTRANLPLPANWQDYDQVVLFVAAPPVDYQPRSARAFGRLMHNVHSLMADQTDDVLDRVAGHPKVLVLRPDVGRASGTLRFDHDLIEAAYQATFDPLSVQITKQMKEYT